MDKKYTSLEHSIRNVVRESIGISGKDKPEGTPRSFLKPVGVISPPKGEEHPGTKKTATILAQRGEDKVQHGLKEEEVLGERYAGGQKSLKPTEKQKQDMESNIKNLPGAIDAGMRGAASSATFGAADNIAAAGDYAVKNTLGRLFGGKGTTYEKEYQQELEKTEKAKKEHPTGYTVGEWIPVAAGGVKAGVSAAKGLYGAAKNAPETIKSFSKWYSKTSPIDTLKAGVNALGGDIVKNPIKYAKEIPGTAAGMAKFGAGLEIADKSVGMPEFVGGQGWKQGSIYDPKKRKEMFSPGGGTKTIQDVGKAGAEMAAPGSVEAGKAAAKGDWDKAGKEATKAVVGATLVNPNLGRFVYDAAASAIAPQYSLTGDGGVSDRIYNKIKKIKENKENLNEGNPALKDFFGNISKAVADKLAKETAAKVAAELAAKEKAKAAAEALAKAKAAETNIVRPEFPSAGAAKPKPTPKPDAPKPEKPYVDKPANVPPGVTPLPVKTPPPYKPSTDPFVPMPPANVPSKVPQRIFPDRIPEPANKPPKRVEPEKPAAPVKKPEPKFPGPKEKPAPTINPYVNPEPKAPPKPDPEKLPDLKPAPYTNPKTFPAARPTPEPGAFPAADPAKKVADDAVTVPKTEPAKDKGKKTDEGGTGKREPEGGKPPRKRRFPFGFGIPGINPQTVAGLAGNVPVKPYLHYAQDYVSFGEAADDERRSIENVARPGGKNRIAKQGEIKAKIIDENAERVATVKKVISDKKNSTVILKPKLKHPELDEN